MKAKAPLEGTGLPNVSGAYRRVYQFPRIGVPIETTRTTAITAQQSPKPAASRNSTVNETRAAGQQAKRLRKIAM